LRARTSGVNGRKRLLELQRLVLCENGLVVKARLLGSLGRKPVGIALAHRGLEGEPKVSSKVRLI